MPKYSYDYPMFALTVDLCLLDSANRICLIKRGGDAEHGKSALVGGFCEINETTLEAVLREAREEIGVDLDPWSVSSAFLADRVLRDSRQRVVSQVFVATVDNLEDLPLKAGDDASAIIIKSVYDLDASDMAFDHYDIIQAVVNGDTYE